MFSKVRRSFTLLTFVRSEEDDPLGPTPLDTYLLYYLLRGLFPCFLLLGRIIIKEWDFKPSAKAQVLAPTDIFSKISNIYLLFNIFKNWGGRGGGTAPLCLNVVPSLIPCPRTIAGVTWWQSVKVIGLLRMILGISWIVWILNSSISTNILCP